MFDLSKNKFFLDKDFDGQAFYLWLKFMLVSYTYFLKSYLVKEGATLDSYFSLKISLSAMSLLRSFGK